MDEFGRDPQVRRMRALFQAIETWERKQASSLGLDWTDRRAGLVRRAALEKFLPDFGRALFSGPVEAVKLYAQAYGRAVEELLPGGGAGPDRGDEDV